MILGTTSERDVTARARVHEGPGPVAWRLDLYGSRCTVNEARRSTRLSGEFRWRQGAPLAVLVYSVMARDSAAPVGGSMLTSARSRRSVIPSAASTGGREPAQRDWASSRRDSSSVSVWLGS